MSTRALFAYALFWLLNLVAYAATAQDSSRTFGDYTVHFSVFNSTFVLPEIAQHHGLTRANNQVLVNISVHRTTDGSAVSAVVEGTAKNLIQQQKVLDFKKIEEADAIYFIAPLRTTEEEVFHFNIKIRPESSPTPYTLEFSKTLYVDK